METFLHEIAQRLLDRHASDLSRVCVVFNNRRSGLFLRDCLREKCSGTFFLPITMGMDDLVHEICGLEIVPKEYLLYELYDIHRNLSQEQDNAQPFDQFLSFGEMMLNDFSEIDLYQADAERLFDNLYELKSIGEWDISGASLTPFQHNYLNFYRSIYHHYTQLRQRLLSQGKAYGGMAYRMAADQVSDHLFSYEHIYFVGFNALSRSEETLIHTLQRQGMATLLCDGDAYYYDHPEQEAGLFLRHLKQRFDSIGDYPDHFAMGEKKITLVDSPEDLMQVKYAGELLRQMAKGENGIREPLQDTALVLADESLLVPVLNSLPEEVSHINVTMGYPMEQTAIHTLTLKLLTCCKNMRRQRIHRNDITDILSDTCACALSHTTARRHDLQEYLLKRERLFVGRTDLQELSKHLKIDTTWLDPLFDIGMDQPDEFLAFCQQTALRLQECESFILNKKDAVSIYSYRTLIDHFTDLQQRYRFINRIDTLERIYQRMAHRLSVPFYGEPLQGLQILGMLETRNLDFRRVILLSANEGILPAGRQENTLIPYHLKLADPFRLPTHEEKDAIYANHFYRLIQRAEEVYIVYSTQSNSSGKGEPSRFVIQLQRELARTHPNLHIQQQVIQTRIGEGPSENNTTDSIAKTEPILQQLRALAEKGFSPSALNRYRTCPMQYYFQYVLGIRDNEDLEDTLNPMRYGTAVHQILHDLYETVKGKENLTTDDLKKLKEQTGEYIQRHFAKMGEESASHGRVYLQQRIANEQILHLIENDTKTILSGRSMQIVALERPLKHPLVLPNGQTVNLQGTADRIDKVDGHLRIVDYKTGKVETRELTTTQENVFSGELSDKAFQVLMYGWLYLQDNADESFSADNIELIESGIYPLGDSRGAFIPLQWDGTPVIPVGQISVMETLLHQLISEIMDPSQPFVVREDNQKCDHCTYKNVCPKHKSEGGNAY